MITESPLVFTGDVQRTLFSMEGTIGIIGL